MVLADLSFLAELPAQRADEGRPPWKVLVVDDEPDVHRVTALIAAGFEFRGRRIELLSAESAQAARAILETHRDIALALVDVVMEHARAGLDLVNHIRHTLDNPLMRIVLRTGQPGDAPEQVVVSQYDISDYREKSQLRSNQLLTVLRTNLATYDALSQLDSAQRHLRQLNEELTQFSRVVAHDLKSPLTNIHTCVQLLRRRHGAELSAGALEFLGQIEQGSAGMSQLVTKLLELAQLGREDIVKEPVDLDEVVAAARANLRAQIESADAVVETGPLPKLRGVRAYLLLLFQNLIENALKYNTSAPPRVRISARTQDGLCVLEVADNGIGIPADDARQIFRPFQRGAGAASAAGSGIGLATCQRAVEAHNGSISVESTPGSGSVFRVNLPVAEEVDRECET